MYKLKDKKVVELMKKGLIQKDDIVYVKAKTGGVSINDIIGDCNDAKERLNETYNSIFNRLRNHYRWDIGDRNDSEKSKIIINLLIDTISATITEINNKFE